MKTLRNILIVIVTLIAIPLVVALFVSKDFDSERSIVIDKPVAEVFDYIKHLKNQDNYGIWNLKDPDMKQEYIGTDGEVGFTVKWESEHPEVGIGEQTITQIVENERVETELRFDGWDNTMLAYMVTEPVDANQTRVIWGAQGRMPYPFNLMMLFMDMADDFDEGLENLKEVIEAQESPEDDMTFLMNYYKATMNNLKQNLSGLSEAQMQFRPSEGQWSVSQCVEHIITTEAMLLDMVKAALEAPETPERRIEIEMADDVLLTAVVDRTEKFKAPEMLHGTGKYNNPEEAIKDMKNGRKEILSALEGKSIDELRNRVMDFPTGKADVYQAFLFIAGHTARHTLQIEEVKADENFPG
jgi:hypothetical protein